MCSTCGVCVLFFDLTGYDEYVPSYDKIENIAIGSVDTELETAYNVKVNEDGTVTMLDSGYYLNGDSTGNDLGIDKNLFDSIKEIAKREQGNLQRNYRKQHSIVVQQFVGSF